MGSKYPVLPPNKIIKVLEKVGFSKISQRGSHVKFKNNTTPQKTVIIPMHTEIAKGTLKSILEQADITLDDFLELL
jgi:predicted RNA binding protein YcfA (HicA-like mRNA interferase family)